MTTTPTTEPTTVTAGDTVTWQKTLSDYPASDSWVLTYLLANTVATYTLTASASGDAHLVTAAASVTAEWPAADYTWHSYITKGAERYTIAYGALTVQPNYADHPTGYDARTHCKKVLDALEAMLEDKASKDQLSYSIGTGSISRTLSRLSPGEVLQWYDKYKADYARLCKQDRIARGLGHKGVIKVRFS